MKHQVYRCLLAKLKGKERVFKPYLCIRFDVSSVPYAPGEIAWHSKKIPYEYAVPNWGASIESLNDVHTDPPFPVDLLAKFLGFLTGALPETNFCLQMRCNYMQLLADLFVFSLFNCVWYRGKPITIMEVIYSVNPGWTLSRFLLEPWMPIFRGKLAELVSGSKRMTWAPWSGHFSSKALPDCWGVILGEWEHY